MFGARRVHWPEEGAGKLVVWIHGLEMHPSGAEARLISLALLARLKVVPCYKTDLYWSRALLQITIRANSFAF